LAIEQTTMNKAKVRWTRLLRYISQAGFAAYILYLSVRHALFESNVNPVPSIDALCPFGGIATLWRFVSEGLYVPKTHLSNLVLVIGLLIGALVAGAAFCGWICPFGALQDLLSGIRKRLRLPVVQVPPQVDRWLRLGRYLMLAGILYGTVATVSLWFAGFDPYRTLFGLGWIFEFDWALNWTAYVVTIIVIVGSVSIHRFWCRYLCPLGALLALVQRLSLFKIQRDPKLCINCGKCAQACPVKLPVDKNIRTGASCIGCLECVEACPKAGALEVGFILPRQKQGEEL